MPECDMIIEQFHKCLFINTGKYSTKEIIENDCKEVFELLKEKCLK